ncbi:hypothetical protein ACT7DH_10410 [Bacillus pacificus]
MLASYFLKEYNKSYKKVYFKWIRKRKERLQAYQWPGNVRELKHTIEHAVIIAEGNTLTANCLRTFRKRVFQRRRAYCLLEKHFIKRKRINRSSIN